MKLPFNKQPYIVLFGKEIVYNRNKIIHEVRYDF